MTLRLRLALAFALLAALVAAAIGVLVYQLTAEDLLDRARTKAVQSARAAARSDDLQAVRPAGAVLVGNPQIPVPLKRAVAAGHVATYKLDQDGAPVIWAGIPSDRHPRGVYTRVSFAADQATLANLRRTLIEVGVAAALGGALLGLGLAQRLSSRLRRAAAAAERVTSGTLTARVRAHGRDEVAALGAAMDRMADSLQERIEHEQRFVANVAHDLRTPVTGLVAAASLLESDQVGAVVQERVSRLQTLVEDLLEISRLENGAATADLRWVDVDAFVRSLAARHRGVLVDAPEPARAFTDPRRLERIVDNLLLNAARHGAPPVTIAVRPGKIVVTDSGEGFSDDMLQRATERFATGDTSRGKGIGLGLAIAAAQARVLGGRLTLANAPGGGAEVTVTLAQRSPTGAAP